MKKKLTLLLSLTCVGILLYRQVITELTTVKKPEHYWHGRNEPLPDSIEEFLNTPLSFLGMGSQCLVFTTPDAPYVLKICKANRYQLPFFLESLPFSFTAGETRKTEKKNKDFSSYVIAYSSLKKETGILLLHLEPGDLANRPLQLKDPLGFCHHFSTDSLRFYIQKKADPLPSYLKKLLREKKIEEVEKLLFELLTMVLKNGSQGFYIKDATPEKNIGLVDGKPFWIDPGRIIALPKNLEPQEILALFSDAFTPFLSELDPSLTLIFQAAYEKALQLTSSDPQSR
jgi:hypothetical protein